MHVGLTQVKNTISTIHQWNIILISKNIPELCRNYDFLYIWDTLLTVHAAGLIWLHLDQTSNEVLADKHQKWINLQPITLNISSCPTVICALTSSPQQPVSSALIVVPLIEKLCTSKPFFLFTVAWQYIVYLLYYALFHIQLVGTVCQNKNVHF